ncbi:hypothetical protein LVJ83_09470 [Uruburuella testudinis]|uniref:Lipoprotein n=1 Tax=Uruburuella testudinis TaxID=1282863 RepID=A0ABY4DQ76_9NEIS|nr:hypothetical protein [Uruburuella testudinis]UOO81196.1 hypothetical protein LVJ83_09470 [Uruburuella testudinis]
MNRTSFTALTAALLLAACSGGNEAGKSTFKKAIDQYAEQHGVCLPLALNVQNPQGFEARAHVTLGEALIRMAETDTHGNKINREAHSQIELLEDQGFYKQADTETLPQPDQKDIKIRRYELTDKGAAQTLESPHGPLFCIGTQEVEKINWFTEPAPANGITVSKVSYQAKFKPERWAEKLLKKGGAEWANIESTRTQTATLVQTNEGWRDIRELR